MKIFEATLKIQTLAPSLDQNATKRAAVGIETKLLRFSAPGFDLVLEAPPMSVVAIAAVAQLIARAMRTKPPLRLLPL